MTTFKQTVSRMIEARASGVKIKLMAEKLGIKYSKCVTAMNGRSTCSLTDSDCEAINNELDRIKVEL